YVNEYWQYMTMFYFFFFSSRRRHTRSKRDWSSDVCSSDLYTSVARGTRHPPQIIAFRAIRARRDTDALVVLLEIHAGVEVPHLRSEERRVGKECRSRGGRGGEREKSVR